MFLCLLSGGLLLLGVSALQGEAGLIRIAGIALALGTLWPSREGSSSSWTIFEPGAAPSAAAVAPAPMRSAATL